MVEGKVFTEKMFELSGNESSVLNHIKTFLSKSQATSKTNILFHEIYVDSVILSHEILKTLCTNQSYLLFLDYLGSPRTIKIDKCIVNLSDLKNIETLDKAFKDNTRYKTLELEHATNVRDFRLFYISLLNYLQTL
jgi:hypothetical protein